MTAETPPKEIAQMDDAAHLDSFRMPDMIDEGPDPDAPEEIGEDGEFASDLPAMMDKDTFWETFQLVFAMPGMFLPDLAPLAIQNDEIQTARPASDACHRLLEIWFPAALRPGNETVGLMLTAAPFIFAKVAVVRMVLAQRAARRRAPQGGVGGEFRSRRAQEAQETQEAPQTPQEAPQGAIAPVDYLGGAYGG